MIGQLRDEPRPIGGVVGGRKGFLEARLRGTSKGSLPSSDRKIIHARFVRVPIMVQDRLTGRSGDRASTKVLSPPTVKATRPLRFGPAPSMETIFPSPY